MRACISGGSGGSGGAATGRRLHGHGLLIIGARRRSVRNDAMHALWCVVVLAVTHLHLPPLPVTWLSDSSEATTCSDTCIIGVQQPCIVVQEVWGPWHDTAVRDDKRRAHHPAEHTLSPPRRTPHAQRHKPHPTRHRTGTSNATRLSAAPHPAASRVKVPNS